LSFPEPCLEVIQGQVGNGVLDIVQVHCDESKEGRLGRRLVLGDERGRNVGTASSGFQRRELVRMHMNTSPVHWALLRVTTIKARLGPINFRGASRDLSVVMVLSRLVRSLSELPEFPSAHKI
jgi:hypothetical protein